MLARKSASIKGSAPEHGTGYQVFYDAGQRLPIRTIGARTMNVTPDPTKPGQESVWSFPRPAAQKRARTTS